MPLKIQLGQSDFISLRENSIFADKTECLKTFMDDPSVCIQVTGPSGYGKSSLVSLIKTFFDKRYQKTPNLFKGLHIEMADDTTFIDKHQGKYHVLLLNLRICGKCTTPKDFYGPLFKQIQSLYKGYAELPLPETECYNNDGAYIALNYLAQYFKKTINKSAILVIEPHFEYTSNTDNDHPNYYFNPFLAECLKGDFVKIFVTGKIPYALLGVSSYSVLGCIQNGTLTPISRNVNHYLGFSAEQVKELLNESELSEHFPVLQEWYGGFYYGNNASEHFSSLSVMQYLATKETQTHSHAHFGHALLMNLLSGTNKRDKKNLFALWIGESATTCISLSPEALPDSITSWSLLLFLGYLSLEGANPNNCTTIENGHLQVALTMPNRQIQSMFFDAFYDFYRSSHSQLEADILFFEDTPDVRNEKLKKILLGVSYVDRLQTTGSGVIWAAPARNDHSTMEPTNYEVEHKPI